MNFTTTHRAVIKRFALILGFACAILAGTWIASKFGAVANAPTAAFSFLILVLLSAFVGDLAVAITTSVVATLCFNYFFLPPIGTFTIAAFDDWISLAAFLLTAVAISRLTSSALENSRKVADLDKALSQLKQFGAWLLATPQDRFTLSGIAEEALRIFALEYCSIHVYTEGKWHQFTGSAASDLSREVSSRLKALGDHPTNLMELVEENALGVRYMQINQGSSPLALLAVKGRALPAGAFGAMANMIGVCLMQIVKEKQPFDLNESR